MRLTYTTHEVADLVGISKRTLLNWLYQEKILEPRRDPRNNYRIWSDHDLRLALEYRIRLTKYQALFRHQRGIYEAAGD